MIKKLIKLANHLDSKGMSKEADFLDQIIKLADEMEVDSEVDGISQSKLKEKVFGNLKEEDQSMQDNIFEERLNYVQDSVRSEREQGRDNPFFHALTTLNGYAQQFKAYGEFAENEDGEKAVSEDEAKMIDLIATYYPGLSAMDALKLSFRFEEAYNDLEYAQGSEKNEYEKSSINYSMPGME